MPQIEPRPFAYHERNWRGGSNKIVPVTLRGSDITGRVLVEFPGGIRDWISSCGLYTDETGRELFNRHRKDPAHDD